MTIQNCKTCIKEFEIEKEDLDFYEKMKSPPPSYCPSCRTMKRLAFRNERTLYKRNCSKSGNPIVSLYPQDAPFPVYDQHIWWGDDWDALDYGQEYNPDRPFFEQLLELRNKVPRISLLNINGVNSDYVNNAEDSKNCYLIFAAQMNEDSMYGRLLYRNKYVVDCSFVADSEFCYECLDCRKCFQCLFCENCENTIDCAFSFDLRDCQNCIFSTNLRHKSYYIFNKAVSKEEYEKKKIEIFSSYENLEEARQQLGKLKEQALVKFAHQIKCKNSLGDYMYNCHDVWKGFDAEDAKNCKYIADAEGPIDSYDLNNTYYKPELCLDVMGALQTYNVKHSVYIMYSSNIEYSDSLHNCDSCFGCVGLKKQKYCILNKQYSKEEYARLKEEIVDSLKRDNVYGDFLPPSFSTFGFNETLANEYFPMSENDTLEKGFNWQNQSTGTFGKETIKESDISAITQEDLENIINEVLACKDCNKNFRITKAELDFYKRMNIPLPHKDFECRHQDRMKKRNPRALWKRSCMCKDAKHMNHEGNTCQENFETSYSPDRKETVYCESCYQQEVS